MLPTPTRLSTGLSDFAAIRRGGVVCVDKTGMVFELTRLPQSFFLSRPRRFGKSLLVSTFEDYFLGRKELFEGLRIYDLENATGEPRVEYPNFQILLFGWGTRERSARVGAAHFTTHLKNTKSHGNIRQSRQRASADQHAPGPLCGQVDDLDRAQQAL